MRKAINDNPMVQLGVIAGIGVIFAFILFTSVLKKDDTSTADSSAGGLAMAPTASNPAPAGTTAEAAATADGVAPATPAAPTATADPTASAPTATTAPATAPPAGGSVSDGLLPSKGLPKDVLVAFAKNEAIVLLVIDPNGTSDKQVKTYTEALKKRNDVQVFIVDVKDVAKYSRITAGVSVSRVPALVIIKPRKLTGSVPTAAVSYGFRGSRSVNQALDDALYKGKQIPSYPTGRDSSKNKNSGNKNK